MTPSTAERKDAFANEREKKNLIFCSALKRPQRMLYFSQRPPHRISFLPHPIFSEEQKGFFLLLSHVSVRLCRSRGSRNAAATPPLPSPPSCRRRTACRAGFPKRGRRRGEGEVSPSATFAFPPPLRGLPSLPFRRRGGGGAKGFFAYAAAVSWRLLSCRYTKRGGGLRSLGEENREGYKRGDSIYFRLRMRSNRKSFPPHVAVSLGSSLGCRHRWENYSASTFFFFFVQIAAVQLSL